MIYTAIICDIVSSRHLDNRSDLQYEIKHMLEDANKKFEDILVYPLSFTSGDEWECVLKYPCDYLSILKFFKEKIPSLKLYTGVGIGNLELNDPGFRVNEVYGTSLYKAREAITIAKEKSLPLVLMYDSWEDVF